MKSNKFWIAVLSLVLLISATAAILLMQTPANIANVYSDGTLVETIDLSAISETYSFTIGAENFNTVEAEPGRIRISDASCPDGSCIRQGWISGGTIPIVCLPHRLVIALENREGPDVDAVVG